MKRFVLCWVLLFIPWFAFGQLTSEEHQDLVRTCRWLGSLKIDYRESWRPPGNKERWVMDCSNTSRYIYEKVFGVKLPRVASSQYWELKQSGKFFATPRLANGQIDEKALLEELRSGDLLFWEWTYDIQRTPPVSHVMVYLGKTASGEPKMAGSASRAQGEQSGGGGVDVYRFRPNAPSGGVKNFFGNYVKRGRFIGYARPLLRKEPIQVAANGG